MASCHKLSGIPVLYQLSSWSGTVNKSAERLPVQRDLSGSLPTKKKKKLTRNLKASASKLEHKFPGNTSITMRTG